MVTVSARMNSHQGMSSIPEVTNVTRAELTYMQGDSAARSKCNDRHNSSNCGVRDVRPRSCEAAKRDETRAQNGRCDSVVNFVYLEY